MLICVRPSASAVCAPGGNAGGCREFTLVLCGSAIAATVVTAAGWSWGVWHPECFSNQPMLSAANPGRELVPYSLGGLGISLIDRFGPVWPPGHLRGNPAGEAFRSASEPILVGRNDPYSGGDRCGPSRLCRR